MFTIPDLPYAYDALEPHIDGQTMKIHHDLHHGGYVKKLNAALEGHDDLLSLTIDELLGRLGSLPVEKQTAVRNNGGGHANHSVFWTSMSPDGGGEPEGALMDSINTSFGDFTSFQETFTTSASTRFGSGWAWLVIDGGELRVVDTANQDSPILDGQIPIVGLDVWEHAYYLKYQNKRPDYIDAWWNVVNWNEVGRKFDLAMK